MPLLLICFVGTMLFRALLGAWIGGYALIFLANLFSATLIAGPLVVLLAQTPTSDLTRDIGFYGADTAAAQAIVLAIGLVRHARLRRVGGERLEADRVGFLRLHWLGERSLVVSVFGSAAQGLLLLAVLFFSVSTEAQKLPGGPVNDSFVIATVLALGLFAFCVWFAVGVIRASLRSAGQARGEGRFPLAAGAAISAVAVVILAAVGLLGRSIVPGTIATGRIAFLNDPDLPPYFIRTLRDGTEIEFYGGFKSGAARAFGETLAKHPKVRVVHLSSGGGRIGEAAAMARLIEGRTLDTYVPLECNSACTIVFAQGKSRWIADNATLGFHAGQGIWGDLSALPSGGTSGGFQSAYTKAGFAPAFVARAVATPHAQLWRPTLTELREARVVTGVDDGARFAMSGVPEKPDWDAFTRDAAKSTPAFAAICDHDPDICKTVAGIYARGYAQMRARRDVVTEVKAVLGKVIDARQPHGDDATMIDLARLLADEYEALGRIDAGVCVQYAFGGGTVTDRTDAVPKQLIQRRMAWEAQIVVGWRPDAVSAPDPEGWKTVYANLSKKIGADKVKLIDAKVRKPEQFADACEAAAGMFREIAALPPAQAGAMMRGVMKSEDEEARPSGR